MQIKYNLQIFTKELLLYAVTMALGLAAAYNNRLSGTDGFDKVQPLEFSFSDILWLVIFFSLFSFIFFRYRRTAGVILKIFFLLVIFSGSQIIFGLFFSPFSSFTLAGLLLVSLGGRSNILIHNIAVILGIAGLSSVLGASINYIQSGLILGILSVYDVIAVYKTRHMVVMAENMVASGAIFGLLIPSKWSGFSDSLKDVELGKQIMILGSGDIALPIVFAASLISISLGAALAAGISSVFGLFATHLIFSNQKKRQPMAALPPIATASILGYLIYTLI